MALLAKLDESMSNNLDAAPKYLITLIAKILITFIGTCIIRVLVALTIMTRYDVHAVHLPRKPYSRLDRIDMENAKLHSVEPGLADMTVCLALHTRALFWLGYSVWLNIYPGFDAVMLAEARVLAVCIAACAWVLWRHERKKGSEFAPRDFCRACLRVDGIADHR